MSSEPTTTYLTPTRRALLEAAHEGRVVEGHDDDHTWLVEVGYEPRKVCARIAEAQRAGWVVLDVPGVFWGLTAVGHAVLGWKVA